MRALYYRSIAAGLLVSISCGAAVSAQNPPPPSAGDDADAIEVIGRRVSEEQARREANEFIRRSVVAHGDRPIARWVSAVCPKVLGIQPEYAAIVERRLRAIAVAADIPVARSGCRTNIVIGFATDARGVVQRIAKKSPRRMQEVSPPDRDALLGGNAPVRWWYSTGATGTEGGELTGDTPLAGAGTAEGGGSALALGAQTVQGYGSSSIIKTQVVRALRSATVVIDVNFAEGVPLDSVAAFAAMVAFAEVRPAKIPPPNSILGLFASDARVSNATDWDISFLKATYSIAPARAGWKQRRMLVGKIMQDARAAGQVDEDLTDGF
jgi:hypothetical protein